MPNFEPIRANDLAGCVYSCKESKFKKQPKFVEFLRSVAAQQAGLQSGDLSADAANEFIYRYENKIQKSNKDRALEEYETISLFEILSQEFVEKKQAVITNAAAQNRSLTQFDLDQMSYWGSQAQQSSKFADILKKY